MLKKENKNHSSPTPLPSVLPLFLARTDVVAHLHLLQAQQCSSSSASFSSHRYSVADCWDAFPSSDCSLSFIFPPLLLFLSATIPKSNAVESIFVIRSWPYSVQDQITVSQFCTCTSLFCFFLERLFTWCPSPTADIFLFFSSELPLTSGHSDPFSPCPRHKSRISLPHSYQVLPSSPALVLPSTFLHLHRLCLLPWPRNPTTTSSKGLVLSQWKYVLDLFHDVGYSWCKPAYIPLNVNSKISTSDGTLLPGLRFYQQLVGNAIYLTITRQDLAYDVSVVSQFMHFYTDATFMWSFVFYVILRPTLVVESFIRISLCLIYRYSDTN